MNASRNVHSSAFIRMTNLFSGKRLRLPAHDGYGERQAREDRVDERREFDFLKAVTAR